jgi:hypothetical protein
LFNYTSTNSVNIFKQISKKNFTITYIQQRHTELNEGTTFRDPSQLSTKQLASRNDFIDVTTVITDYVNINAQPRPPQTRNNGKQ